MRGFMKLACLKILGKSLKSLIHVLFFLFPIFSLIRFIAIKKIGKCTKSVFHVWTDCLWVPRSIFTLSYHQLRYPSSPVKKRFSLLSIHKLYFIHNIFILLILHRFRHQIFLSLHPSMVHITMQFFFAKLLLDLCVLQYRLALACHTGTLRLVTDSGWRGQGRRPPSFPVQQCIQSASDLDSANPPLAWRRSALHILCIHSDTFLVLCPLSPPPPTGCPDAARSCDSSLLQTDRPPAGQASPSHPIGGSSVKQVLIVSQIK